MATTFSNQMSLSALKASQNNANLDIVVSPKTGKMFFSCGSVTGAVADKLQKEINTVSAEDIEFAMISIDGQPAVPCLFKKGANNNTVRRF